MVAYGTGELTRAESTAVEATANIGIAIEAQPKHGLGGRATGDLFATQSGSPGRQAVNRPT